MSIWGGLSIALGLGMFIRLIWAARRRIAREELLGAERAYLNQLKEDDK